MFRRSLSIACLFAAALPPMAPAQKPVESDPVFSQIDGIVKTLSEITGLSQKKPVPYGRMTKRQLRQFLTKRIRKTLRPEDIRADEMSLKMFGLVPQDFDLKKSTLDLLTEQAAAFYDYDEKKLFLLADESVQAETTTLAHELSHALADQHFNLENFMEETPSNDDENLAHTAVVEGEASWLMLAYELKRAGQKAEPSADALKTIADSGDTSMSDFPVLKNSPLYIQQSLLFPYAQGTMFFDAVYHKLGVASFAAVFKDPPVDSAQIIHPERYFAHVKPAEPELPKLSATNPPKTTDEKEWSSGSMGEFDHNMLLRQYLGAPKADALAPHLRGGQFRILTRGKNPAPLLQYAAEWDSNEQAAAYFEAYQAVLKAKWKQCEVAARRPKLFAGTGDNGYFVVRLNGTVVSSVEGLSNVEEWQRLQGQTGGL